MRLFDYQQTPDKIDAEVRARLADSLEYLYSVAGDNLGIDQDSLESACHSIRKRRQLPCVVARYYDLVFAAKAGDYSSASNLLGEILELSKEHAHFAVKPYSEKELVTDFERFPRLLFSEYEEHNPMAEPDDKTYSSYADYIHSALETIRNVDKKLFDEITGLFSRVYIATSNKHKSAGTFAGVTSFMIWGATFVNVDVYKTRWKIVQFLVHEVTHSLLYGLSCGQPLVLNSPSENYKSPLRNDARPMDGIYHATLVCARLAAFNKEWLKSNVLLQDDREDIEKETERCMTGFQDGAETILRHGKLSDQASQLLERSCNALSVSF